MFSWHDLRPAYPKFEAIIREKTESLGADAAADEQLCLVSCFNAMASFSEAFLKQYELGLFCSNAFHG